MVVNGHSKPELYLENSSNNPEVSILGVESTKPSETYCLSITILLNFLVDFLVILKGTKKFGSKVIMKILSIINFTTKLFSTKGYFLNGLQ